MSFRTDLSNLDSQVYEVGGWGALKLPLGSNVQRPSRPASGMIRWNTNSKRIEFYSETQWTEILGKQEIEDRFVDKDNPVFNGPLDANGFQVVNMIDPVDPDHGVRLGYLEQRFASGTGINAETLGGNPSFYYATQQDVLDLQDLVADVQENVDTHIADTSNPHQVTKDQVGLDRVDNTNDMEKPISTATAAALGTKVNRGGDVMQGPLSMGYQNLIEIDNFVGSIWYFPLENPPAGFLVANGAAVSRLVYARLFDKIGTRFGAGNGTTTFNLPDLRGMFIRGWDSSSYPTDPARVLGSYQEDMFKSHNHPGSSTAPAGNHRHRVEGHHDDSTGDGYPGEIGRTNTNYSFYTDYDGIHSHGVVIGAEGGAETRPKNIALLVCIMF